MKWWLASKAIESFGARDGSRLPKVNWARGFLRIWIVLSVLWFSGVLLIHWPRNVPAFLGREMVEVDGEWGVSFSLPVWHTEAGYEQAYQEYARRISGAPRGALERPDLTSKFKLLGAAADTARRRGDSAAERMLYKAQVAIMEINRLPGHISSEDKFRAIFNANKIADEALGLQARAVPVDWHLNFARLQIEEIKNARKVEINDFIVGLLGWAVWSIVPPLLLLGFGLLMRWVGKGFIDPNIKNS